MTRRTAGLIVIASVWLFADCRKSQPQLTTGISEMEILPPEVEVTSAKRDRRKRTAESAPKTLAQALPNYPKTALADSVDCRVRLLFHIEIDGTARMVRLAWEHAPPVPHVAAFESAIHSAVATWQFEPAKRYDYRMDDEGKIDVSGKPIPKARNAIISFRVENGRPVVE
jgi:outer membrane biosynthesis protein TonB